MRVRNLYSSSERPRAVPAVPGFVNENGAMGKRTLTAGAASEFGCAGHGSVERGRNQISHDTESAGPAPQVYRHLGIKASVGVYKPPPPLYFHCAIAFIHWLVKKKK